MYLLKLMILRIHQDMEEHQNTELGQTYGKSSACCAVCDLPALLRKGPSAMQAWGAKSM